MQEQVLGKTVVSVLHTEISEQIQTGDFWYKLSLETEVFSSEQLGRNSVDFCEM